MMLKNKLLAAALAFTLTLGGVAHMTGCTARSNGGEPITEDVTSDVAVELDYSLYSSTMLYDVMTKFSGNSDLLGKTVKIHADYGAVFDFSSNSFVNVIEQYDATACCAAYYPLEFDEGIKVPALGSEIEMVGTFCDGYISVSAVTLYSGSFDETEININAANMSSDDIKNFTNKIRALKNDYVGQTVRICGHYSKSSDGFLWLVGYEGDNSSATPTWSVEIHSESVSFPEIKDKYIRAYEVIGTVSSYKTPDGKEWPCIEVQSIRPITTFTV